MTQWLRGLLDKLQDQSSNPQEPMSHYDSQPDIPAGKGTKTGDSTEQAS